MTIQLGEKIKQLRRRDGRKQEDLANALGVSPQAVSRWEANGGYPDIGLLPAIANYFNITIDELFGYSKDREEKLKTILSKAETEISKQGDMTETVEMLRAAAEEFPSEPQVLKNLGFALILHGWKKHGAASYTKDDSDYAYEDTEYNSQNVYWQEALLAFEKALTLDISAENRDVITLQLVLYNAKMGHFDKAMALAEKQNSLRMSKEFLLPLSSQGEERDKYQGEAIIELLTALQNVVVNSVCTKVSLITKHNGTELLLHLAQLCEAVFSDGQCGILHTGIRDLYLWAAFIEARYGEGAEKAFEHFRKGFEHHRRYQRIRCTGTYHYTAPLAAKVTFPSENFPAIPDNFWKGKIEGYPNDLKEQIKSDPQFAECFID